MDAIILATNKSSRKKQNALLFPINEKPMYQHIVDLLYKQKREGILQNILVVSQHEDILHKIEKKYPDIISLLNESPKEGISKAIKIGIAGILKANPNSEGCLFAEADHPYVSRKTIDELEHNWRISSKRIMIAGDKNKMGIPVIFSHHYYQQLGELEGEKTGQYIVENNMLDVELVQIPKRELEPADYHIL